jgi:sialate O-acetylesterase
MGSLNGRCSVAARLALLAFCCPGFLIPAVRLPYLFADGMVVQRERPVHVWGMAAPGEKVAVSFRGETKSVAADELGRWSLRLSPGAAGGPFTLAVNDRTIRDVLVGDVWIAAGQSNMEWPVRWSANPQAEMKAANYPRIRLARTMHRVSGHPVSDWVGQQWQPATAESVEHFSAVAYHFAREMQAKLQVPIGIIQSAWGGTPIEAWTSLRGLARDPALISVFDEWGKLMERHETEALRFPGRVAEWKRSGSQGESPELRRRPGGQWQPAGLYNAMIAPLTRWPIRGVIWYQGEANTSPERAPLYERMLPALIRDWREQWAQGDFPFLFVQLANYDAVPESQWPVVREAQRRTLAVANTAMAVAIDIGESGDIHPKDKREVGRRLALAAHGVTGPLFRQAVREGRSTRLWFDAADRLVARGELSGFEVAGEDGVFTPVKARVEGNTVVLEGTGDSVRYAWSDNPAATLFSASGLPASPFVGKVR